MNITLRATGAGRYTHALLYAGHSDKLVRLDPSRPPSLYSSPRRKPFRPVCAFGSITGGWPVLSRGVGTGWFSPFLLPAAYHRSNPPSPERPSALYFVCTHIETPHTTCARGVLLHSSTVAGRG